MEKINLLIRYYIIIFVILILLSSYLLFVAYSEIGTFGFPLDDSWIHLTFARNIATGNGYSYNPGESVSGSTAPLWTIVLGFTYLLTKNIYIPVYITGILFTFLSCIILVLLAKTLLNEYPFLLFISIAGVLTSPLIWTAISGMEPPLFTFLVLIGIYFHIKYKDAQRLKQYLSTILFGLVVWVRPECSLIFPLAILDRVLSRDKQIPIKKLVNSFVLHSILFSIIVLSWIFFNYRLSGYIFPTTFYAKQYFFHQLGITGLLNQGKYTELIPFILKGLWKWDWYLFVQFSFSNIFLIFFFIPGIIELILQVKSHGSNHCSYLIPLLLVLQPTIVGLIAPAEGGSYLNNRYFTQLFPLFTLVSSYGLFRIIRYIVIIHKGNMKFATSSTFLEKYKQLQSVEFKFEWLGNRIYKTCTIISFFILIFWGISSISEEARIYKLNVKNISEMQVHIANYIRTHTEPDSVIATNDIGALGFFSQRKIVDLVGLITPQIIPYYMKPGRRDDHTLEYLLDNPVDYLVIFPEWYPDLVKHTDLFQKVYQVKIKENITCGSDTMVVYKMNTGKKLNNQKSNKL